FIPPLNKGLSVIQPELFRKVVDLAAVRVNAHHVQHARTILQRYSFWSIEIVLTLHSYLLDVPRVRAVVDDPATSSTGSDETSSRRLMLLKPEVDGSAGLDPTSLKALEEIGAEHTTFAFEMTYDFWTADQILRSVLPEELDIPGSFETVGHIAHLNLRDQYLPYKKVIGQVILQKNKHIRTVVNKTDSIDHTFRFFKMELLAGENNTKTEVKEHGCIMKFDLSKVYWNSRLQVEHDRLVKMFKPRDIVCDVFAGVGPFALPAAKNKGCTVFANDLNPSSYQYLCENIETNKLGGKVVPFNLDGRQFIRQSLSELNNPSVWASMASKQAEIKRQKRKAVRDKEVGNVIEISETSTSFKTFGHYVMNLPATAVDFLDAFRGLFWGREKEITAAHMPIIHCHTFSKADDPEADVIARAEVALGGRLSGNDIVHIQRVRDVAPKKEMLCISFRLPMAVAFEE
ncbi:guanine(37)-N1-methyltransferase, partial [Cladochytrium replicatum]